MLSVIAVDSLCAALHFGKVAQNERTIFTFLAEEEQGSLSWLLQKGIEDFIGIVKFMNYF